MNLGYGSIFIRIFNTEGTLVFDKATRLTYKHSDKAEDYSTVIIETEDVSIVDHPDLQEDKAIIVTWGYLDGAKRSHKVYIFDTKPTFGGQGVRLELQCYCKLAYLRLGSQNSVYQDTSLDELTRQVAESMGMEYEEQGLSQPTPESAAPTIKPTGEAITFGGQEQTTLNLNTNAITLARDNTANVRYGFIKHSDITQGNDSEAKMLDKLADREPTDNLVIDGHDDALIIRKRDFYQTSYKSFKYRAEPGHLLEFTPASNNTSNKKGAVANVVQGWDAEGKEFVEGLIDSTHSASAVLGDSVEMATQSILRQNLQRDLENPVGQPIVVGAFFENQYEGLDENGNPFYRKVAVEKLDSTKSNWVHVVKRGVRPGIIDFKKGYVHPGMDATARIEHSGFLRVSPQEIVQAEAEVKKNMAGEGRNRQSKKQAEIIQANATVLGDPELESAKVITILGVGNKYSGNYYISCVTHEVNPEGGYTCYLDLLRNGWNNTGNESRNKIDARALGLDKNVIPAIPADGTQELLTIPIQKD